MAVRNSLLVLFTASSVIVPPCIADTSTASTAAGSPPAASSTATGSNLPFDSSNSSRGTSADSSRKPITGLNPPGASASLQGNIQGGAPVILQGLHDIAVTVHHLQEMLKGLLYEAQRQDMVVVAEPDVIGPIVMPAIPNPSGMMSMGYLPPRKKWVDYFMAQIEEIIPMLDHEINSLPRPDASDTALQQAYI
ncbi:MAG: hypothetical protein IT342_25755, partial [Candidatus Melainabacteria bacterium]|nr:hypothetical protein [Candidatus Melainabacteria bacterium]